MTGKPISPPYRAMLERNKYNCDFSFFETAKDYQERLYSEIIRKFKNAQPLAHELAQSVQSHANRFHEEVISAFETDCEKGCSYCCHQPATVFAFEAIQLAEVLRRSLSSEQLEALTEKMKERVTGLSGSSVRQSINNKTACPLLADGKCSVYENRPLTCRMAHSFSAKRCRLAFQRDRLKIEIPISIEIQTGISGILEATYEQLPKDKLDGNLYELCSAVLAALSDPNADAKWATGDRSVFKDCVKDDT